MMHFARTRMPKPKRADGDRYSKRTAGVFPYNLTKVVESEKLFEIGPQEVLREALRQSHQIGLTSGTGMMDLTRATTMIGLTSGAGMMDLKRATTMIGLTSGAGMMDLTRATTMIGLTRATGMVDLISGVCILESLHGFLILVFKRIYRALILRLLDPATCFCFAVIFLEYY